jgi:hypothetical protein
VQRLILLLSFATVGYIVYYLYLKNLKKPSKAQAIKMGLAAAGIFFIIMAMTGRASAIFAAFGALLTAGIRYYPMINRYAPQLKGMYKKHIDPNANINTTSSLTTSVFVMTLDHETGTMDAQITKGSYTGRSLSSLKLDELQSFYGFCQSCDAQATQILQTYIQKERLSEWQQGTHHYSAQSSGDTSLEEALNILGLKAGATKKEIVTAHRRLMSRMHSDKGGSNYLAAKINEAKSLLLKNIA